MKEINDKTKRRKLRPIFLIVPLLMILCITIVFGFSKGKFYTDGDKAPSSSMRSSSNSASLVDSGSAIPGVYTPKSHDEILSELQKEQITVTDKVSAQISFSNGTKGTVGTWMVENPASNNVIEQCEVVLDGKTVVKSVPIYPGQHIENITLLEKVDPGTYDVIATISYYSTNARAFLGKAGYCIKLSIW